MTERKPYSPPVVLNHEEIPSTKEAMLVWCLGFQSHIAPWAREFVYFLASDVDETPEPTGGCADLFVAALHRAFLSEWQRRRIEEIHGDALNLTHDHCPELAERARAVLLGHGFDVWYAQILSTLASWATRRASLRGELPQISPRPR